MESNKLYELYLKVSDSSMTSEKFDKELAWLTGANWSAESIFFSINYCGRYYKEDLKKSLQETLDENHKELLSYYRLAKQKQEIQKSKEGAQEYDSTNDSKRADPPSWFRKGIDFSLFE